MSSPSTNSIGVPRQAAPGSPAALLRGPVALALLLALAVSDASSAADTERCRHLFGELLRVQAEIRRSPGGPISVSPVAPGSEALELYPTLSPEIGQLELEELDSLEKAMERLRDYAFFLKMEKSGGGPAEGLDQAARDYLQQIGQAYGLPFELSWYRRQDEYVASLTRRVEDRYRGLSDRRAKEQNLLESLFRERRDLESDLKAECPIKVTPLPRNDDGRLVVTVEVMERCDLSECMGSSYPAVFTAEDARDALQICAGLAPMGMTRAEIEIYDRYRPAFPGAFGSDKGPPHFDCVEGALKLIGDYAPSTPVAPAPAVAASTSPPSTTAGAGRWVRRGSGTVQDRYVFAIREEKTPDPAGCGGANSLGQTAACWDGQEHKYGFTPPAGFHEPFCVYYHDGAPNSLFKLEPVDGSLWVCARADEAVDAPSAGATPEPETGPLPFGRRPDGAPIMTADLVERYLKARAGGNAKESAYWRLGRFDTFGYTDVESRVSLWLNYGKTSRRFEFFSEAELNALESRRADIERVYY